MNTSSPHYRLYKLHTDCETNDVKNVRVQKRYSNSFVMLKTINKSVDLLQNKITWIYDVVLNTLFPFPILTPFLIPIPHIP